MKIRIKKNKTLITNKSSENFDVENISEGGAKMTTEELEEFSSYDS